MPFLSGVDLSPGLSLFLNTGSLVPLAVDVVNGSLQFTYPGGMCGPPQCPSTQNNYGFALFSGEQPRDFSTYQALVLHMSGDAGSSVEVAVQDPSQKPGMQTTVLLSVSPQLQTYYIPLSWFLNANLKNLSFPAEIIFKGTQVRETDRFKHRLHRGTAGGRPTAAALDLRWWLGHLAPFYQHERSGRLIPCQFFRPRRDRAGRSCCRERIHGGWDIRP